MTRINCGIPVEELTNKHLMAEHREIKRIPNCVAKGRYNLKEQPSVFTLGKGHVKFFYDKLGYLKKRYELLYAECVKRNFKVQYYGDAWNNIPIHLMKDYLPTQADKALIRQRIKEKINKIQSNEC